MAASDVGTARSAAPRPSRAKTKLEAALEGLAETQTPYSAPRPASRAHKPSLDDMGPGSDRAVPLAEDSFRPGPRPDPGTKGYRKGGRRKG